MSGFKDSEGALDNSSAEISAIDEIKSFGFTTKKNS
jgi:hypothetical protein